MLCLLEDATGGNGSAGANCKEDSPTIIPEDVSIDKESLLFEEDFRNSLLSKSDRQVWSLHSIFFLKFFEIENSQICFKDFGFYDLWKCYLLTAEDAIVFSTFLPHSASFLANKD